VSIIKWRFWCLQVFEIIKYDKKTKANNKAAADDENWMRWIQDFIKMKKRTFFSVKKAKIALYIRSIAFLN